MSRRLLPGLLFAIVQTMVTMPTIAAEPLRLTCAVTSLKPGSVDQFSAMLCQEAQTQLRELSGQPVDIVDTIDGDTPWLRIDVTIRSPYAAVGTAHWGGGAVAAGQSEEFEAGISDATLNGSTATLLVRALLAVTPYAAPDDVNVGM